jgi:hypothetical protein
MFLYVLIVLICCLAFPFPTQSKNDDPCFDEAFRWLSVSDGALVMQRIRAYQPIGIEFP